MVLSEWIYNETKGSKSVVEFGAMFCERMGQVHETVVNRIAMEIHEPYLAKATYAGCSKVCCDMRRFEDYIPDYYMDYALFVDSLEHLSKEDAVDLITRVKGKFNKILLMIPEGNHPQTKDVFEMGADEHQTHRSSWSVDDVKALGFTDIIVDPLFHSGEGGGKDSGCIFATWTK